jgi:hypothetical protein
MKRIVRVGFTRRTSRRLNLIIKNELLAAPHIEIYTAAPPISNGTVCRSTAAPDWKSAPSRNTPCPGTCEPSDSPIGLAFSKLGSSKFDARTDKFFALSATIKRQLPALSGFGVVLAGLSGPAPPRAFRKDE